jgi:hypothetical protein
MNEGHGNSLIDSDTGEDSRSPLHNPEPMVIGVCIEVKFWDEGKREWILDNNHRLEDVAVNVDELTNFIKEKHGDSFNEKHITAIKNHADEVIINYWIGDYEVEKFEMYYE